MFKIALVKIYLCERFSSRVSALVSFVVFKESITLTYNAESQSQSLFSQDLVPSDHKSRILSWSVCD